MTGSWACGQPGEQTGLPDPWLGVPALPSPLTPDHIPGPPGATVTLCCLGWTLPPHSWFVLQFPLGTANFLPPISELSQPGSFGKDQIPAIRNSPWGNPKRFQHLQCNHCPANFLPLVHHLGMGHAVGMASMGQKISENKSCRCVGGVSDSGSRLDKTTAQQGTAKEKDTENEDSTARQAGSQG